jgi:LETM1 and EF-hand domain-containing protein 1, mitochondrial
MSARTALRLTPLLRGAPRYLRASRALPSRLPPTSAVIARYGYATDTSTHGGSGPGGPPPGFNIKEAQKPLSKEQQKAKDSSAAELAKQAAIPQDGPTSHPKAQAAEAQTLAELAAEKANADKVNEKKLAKKKEEDKKLTLWQKVKKEAVHYWDGTKLLATEAKISSKLALKMAAGYELTRRENRQVRHVAARL